MALFENKIFVNFWNLATWNIWNMGTLQFLKFWILNSLQNLLHWISTMFNFLNCWSLGIISNNFIDATFWKFETLINISTSKFRFVFQWEMVKSAKRFSNMPNVCVFRCVSSFFVGAFGPGSAHCIPLPVEAMFRSSSSVARSRGAADDLRRSGDDPSVIALQASPSRAYSYIESAGVLANVDAHLSDLVRLLVIYVWWKAKTCLFWFGRWT